MPQSKRRICGKVEESITHLLSKCNKPDQKESKRRQDFVRMHFSINQACWFDITQMHEHEPETIMVKDNYRVFIGFFYRNWIGHKGESMKLDTIRDWPQREVSWKIPDRVDTYEPEKSEKYQDLIRRLKELWRIKKTIVSVLISIFGTTQSCWHLRGWGILEWRQELTICREMLSKILQNFQYFRRLMYKYYDKTVTISYLSTASNCMLQKRAQVETLLQERHGRIKHKMSSEIWI